MKDRAEHLAWCKQRALEYVDAGDLASAVASMTSDLGKHEQTATGNHHLMMLGMLYVAQHNVAGVRRWIEGFN
jgi:hypothetical protein